ncbi:flagellar motor switch protein FliN [Megalodesulfovibrio gigas]|uniref:Flagellar motor switch protein FliN n=1 Tax=Megalodesulfovibrio gigas (strain ATCC 19364 / DSM 1382 / NCIMB 9332 / VKM B-1759) TaxID=1121448 RepID=T2G905_MEGG1|nr:flagellar motor switch protein FliN [Megalodesulfovibrio gigas]AGW12778.1 putative flagellar motor switch protein FliN [Megalodesulfovibrio gigas DSM 1382 = ATCC 19364]
MSNDIDQDKLAEEWAAALADQDNPGLDDDPMDMLGGKGAMSSDNALAEEWARALAEDEGDRVKKSRDQDKLSRQAKKADFKDLTDEAKSPRVDNTRRELDFILDIPLDVSAELGRTRLLINELLQLGQGSVVELNKLAGEPLEIYVNGKLVARGEAVVINEKFGVRLTDIISPIERVKQLG